MGQKPVPRSAHVPPRLGNLVWRPGIGHYVDFSISAKIHIITDSRLPFVITLQQFTNIPQQQQKRYIQDDSNESRIQLIQYKDPNNSGRNNIASDYGQDTNWTKSPEDNRWRPIPAQAKPEGFPS